MSDHYKCDDCGFVICQCKPLCSNTFDCKCPRHYITENKPVVNKDVGRKFDNGKLRMSLFPLDCLQEILKVLQAGSEKYSDYNWQKVENARERYYNAANRHLQAWWSGEKTDPEQKTNHLANVCCNIIFLLWFDLNEKK